MNFYVKEVVEKELAQMRKNHKMVSFDFDPKYKANPWVRVDVKWQSKERRWLMVFDFGYAGYLMTEAGVIHITNPLNSSELFDGCDIEKLDEKRLIVSTVDCSVEELWRPVNAWLCHVSTVLEKENVLIKKKTQEK